MDECLFEADIEKELGNVAYRNRCFLDALKHYELAHHLNPTNIIYKNNLGAVYYELENFTQCIAECEEAIKIGLAHNAEHKHLAKAYCRIGNAFLKLSNVQSAMQYYRQSLIEQYDLNIHNKLQELETRSKYNPELSAKLKNLGNDYFNKGDFPSALCHLSEAIKQYPQDSTLYSYRAACYAKLLEFKAATADCNSCLALDPKCVKALICKGLCLLAMRDYHNAEESFIAALEIQPESTEALHGFKRCLRQRQLDPETIQRQAMLDPEVKNIMSDPIIRRVLSNMTLDPKAINSHLKSPEFAKKIEKLMEVGLIAIR